MIDAAAVDGRRRLVLIRRDNVEHLLMIGGPSDVVVEQNIMRAVPVAPAREAPVTRAAGETMAGGPARQVDPGWSPRRYPKPLTRAARPAPEQPPRAAGPPIPEPPPRAPDPARVPLTSLPPRCAGHARVAIRPPSRPINRPRRSRCASRHRPPTST